MGMSFSSAGLGSGLDSTSVELPQIGHNIACPFEEGLYLGSYLPGSALYIDLMKNLNITHVLALEDAEYFFYLYQNDFVCKKITVSDSEEHTDIVQYFEECCNFIDEVKSTGGSVLIHSYLGKSKCATVVAAYLMKKRGLNLAQALHDVTSKFPTATFNKNGFFLQLQTYEKSLKDSKEERPDREADEHYNKI